MLSIYEMSLLYALARHFYTGRGLIVDAGPLLGASTFALARGLADNPNIDQRDARIYSYDLFRSHGYERFLTGLRPTAVTGSLLREFLATNRSHLDSIVPHQGDFISWDWPKHPIEIFFLDLAKSWELNAHAVKNYFPHLIPNQSILIQQDYVHYNEYWIHITMEHFSDHFIHLGYMCGATSYYLCKKQIGADNASFDLKGLPYDKKMELLTRARLKAPPEVQQVMKCAAAKCSIENGKLEDAASLLNDVRFDVKGDHPTMDFSGIAKSNHELVSKLLASHRQALKSTATNETSSITARDDIRGAYRHLLGREPESEDVVERHLKNVTDLNSLRARFLSAPEFYQTNARELLRYLAAWEARRNRGSVEYDCSSADLGRLFAHIKKVWSKLGEVEPHFSVVSTQNFKPENLESNIEAFHRSGKGEVDLLQAELTGHGLKTAGYSHCVELGCGVGRVTRFLARMSDRLTGFDVSAPHLKLANEYLTTEGVRNASLELIKDLESAEFPTCDLFYSQIVLQHNPPPVMFFLLRKFLRALIPGGVAVFQLPTFIDGYTFKVATYLDGMDKLDNQEIHALPQKAVFAAIADADCDVLSTYRDNSLSKITQISNRFVVMKR